MSVDCRHCRNGFFDGRFGPDVECVNGVLIDIDVANEGWDPSFCYPVAPCHPDWAKQVADDDFCSTDTNARLDDWASQAPSEADGYLMIDHGINDDEKDDWNVIVPPPPSSS